MRHRSDIGRSIVIALAMLGSRGVLAHPDTQPAPDDVSAPPPTYKATKVVVDEHLGSKVPFDAPFRTQDGKLVTLGDLMTGELPTILTFNYSDCPMLCSLQLNGLTAALPKVGESGPSPDMRETKPAEFRVGRQFKIVTIDLEPGDSPDKVSKMRERYLARLPEDQRDAARSGWTYLVAALPGDGSQIRRVADTVGFSYAYVPERAEWAHPAALIFLSATGVVTRYVYGIEFEPQMMRESIFKAGLAEPTAAVGFMNRCYHYDPDANSHAHAGVVALRIGAAGFVLLMISVFGLMHFLKRQRPSPGTSKGRRHGDIRS